MSIILSIDRIKRINFLIKFEKTGTPDEFSRKLNISRSMLYNYIEEIKTMGAVIKYNRIINSFFYENEFDVKIEVIVKNENPINFSN